MITIRNNELFKELKEKYDKGATEKELWKTLFKDDFERKDLRIPYFAGGLDHVEVKAKGIYFIDMGANNKDNSFVIRPEIKKEVLKMKKKEKEFEKFAEKCKHEQNGVCNLWGEAVFSCCKENCPIFKNQKRG